MLMRIYTNLFFVTILWIGLLAPFNGFAKQIGLLPLTLYPPVLVQKMDSCKLSCQDIKVYVTNNCSYEITPAEILGECFPLFQGYVIVYDGVNMTPVRGGVIDRLGIFPTLYLIQKVDWSAWDRFLSEILLVLFLKTMWLKETGKVEIP